jgi:putative endonuclease
MAHRFLQKLGYIVVARNWRAEDGSGELDIVAWDGISLVAVEVKTRATSDFGLPDEAVDAEKRVHLARTAARYLRESDVPASRLRFDIVSVLLSGEGSGKPRIDHIRNAFSCQL